MCSRDNQLLKKFELIYKYVAFSSTVNCRALLWYSTHTSCLREQCSHKICMHMLINSQRFGKSYKVKSSGLKHYLASLLILNFSPNLVHCTVNYVYHMHVDLQCINWKLSSWLVFVCDKDNQSSLLSHIKARYCQLYKTIVIKLIWEAWVLHDWAADWFSQNSRPSSVKVANLQREFSLLANKEFVRVN